MKKLILILFLSMPCMAITVNGRLVDQDNNGVANATVVFMNAETLCPTHFTNTDNSGNFSLEADAGSYLVSWQSADSGVLMGYRGNSGYMDLSTAVPMEVNSGLSGVQVMQVQIGGTITGRINGLPAGAVAQVSVLDAISLLPASPFSSQTVIQGDGTFAVTGLATGCYLVGLSWDEISSPVFFHPSSPLASGGTLINVTAGELVSNVNIDIDVTQLGTLSLNLGAGVDGANPDLTVFGNHFTYSGSFSAGISNILLPPGTYQGSVDFDHTWRTLNLDTQVVQAGQTTSVSQTPVVGGVISGNISQNGVNTFGGLFVQALDASNNVVAEQEFLVVIGSTPYSLSGLDPGTYRVRVNTETSFVAGLSSSFESQISQSVVITGDNQVTGVDFSLVEGGVISGQLLDLGGGLPLFTPVTAINNATGNQYSGFASPNFQTGEVTYQIGNLPAGDYKVGVHTGELSSDNTSATFILDAMSFPLLGCNNVGPSFHSSSGTLAGATTVSVAQGGTVEGVNIPMNPGGAVTGRIVGDDQCPLNSGFVGAYQNGELKRLGMLTDGAFEIAGLGAGNYELRLSKLFLAFEDPTDIQGNVGNGFLDFFSPANSIPYQETITITQGVFQSIGIWTVPLGPITNGTNSECPEPGETDLKLLYPWVSNRTGSFESILIANNYGDEEVIVTLTATRSTSNVETVCRTIQPRGFLEESASSLFPILGSGSGYSVVLTAPSDSVRGRWVTNSLAAPSKKSPSQGVAIRIPRNDGELNSRIGNEVVFGYLPITGNAISAPVVVNAGPTAADVTFTFYDSQGLVVGSDTQNLEPWVPFAALANSLVSGTSGDVYMTAESANLITGVSFVFDSVFNEPAIGNVTAINTDSPDSGAKTLSYPWVSNRADLFESIVVVNNYGDAPVTVSLIAKRGNGETSQPVVREISAHGFIKDFASQLFPNLGDGPGYHVTLTSPSSKVSGQWVTNNLAATSGSSPSQGVAVDISDQPDSEKVGTNLLFGYLPLTGSFTSAPVIINTGTEDTQATLSFYDASGSLVRRTTETLSPSIPFAAIANDLVQSLINVYLVVSSDGQPLTGVAFVFNGEFNEPAIGNATAIDFQP